jgi:uncharacterized protein YneF (UPF0154 family)
MNQELAKTIRIWLTLLVLGIFSGIYVGATSVRRVQKDEIAHNQRVALNCLEVIIGKRPKGKVCQN